MRTTHQYICRLSFLIINLLIITKVCGCVIDDGDRCFAPSKLQLDDELLLIADPSEPVPSSRKLLAVSQANVCNLQPNVLYRGATILSATVPSATECCLRCQLHPSCQRFSFFAKKLRCELKNPRGWTRRSVSSKARVTSGILPATHAWCSSLPNANYQAKTIATRRKVYAVRDCCRLCIERSSCAGWTWSGRDYICSLKVAGKLIKGRRATKNRLFISGVVMRPPPPPPPLLSICFLESNIEYVGTAINKGVVRKVPSAENCCQLCNRRPGCHRFTWSAALKRCRLLPITGWTRRKLARKSNVISGRMARPS
jgi:hypothetical protein